MNFRSIQMKLEIIFLFCIWKYNFLMTPLKKQKTEKQTKKKKK